MRENRVMAMFLTKEIILMFLFLGSAASLQVSIMPAQGEVSVGESKFFLCEVVGAVKGIDWFSPSGEKIESSRQDITVIRNDETSSTLTIYNAIIDNAGTYKCVATSGDQQAEATVNVKIYQKITFKNVTSPQEFTEGDDAIIVCDVISSPPPTIMWKHKRAKIQFDKDVRFKNLDNNHLQIRGIRKADEGVYTCEARIMARGEIDFRDIRVVVNVVPTIRVRQAEVNATADISHSAMLACDADGFPEPTITWMRSLRREVLLESGIKYSFNEDGSEITIMDVKKLDEGDYTCIARNKAGMSEEEVGLRVFVKPKITYLENQTTTEMEEQIRLTCEATGDPTPSITWSFGTHVFAEGEQASWTRPEQHKSEDGSVVVRSDARVSSLTLKYVQYTDAGQYLCTASNAVGQSSQSTFLEVRYAPKILGSVAVYTWEGNPANISCEILAHPSDVSIMWLRDGLQLPNANSTNVKIYTTPTASYLQVNPDSQNDFGSYNCTASNEIGTESKEFILIQADVPSAPTITQVNPYSSTAEVLFDEPEASGGVPVLKYHAEWRVGNKNKWVQRIYEVQEGLSAVTITGLKPDTKYEVKMSAINGKGEGESSSIVAFKTEPVQDADGEDTSAKEDALWPSCTLGHYPAPRSLGPASIQPNPAGKTAPHFTFTQSHHGRTIPLPLRIKNKTSLFLHLICLLRVFVHPTAALSSHSGGECGHEHSTKPQCRTDGHGTRSGHRHGSYAVASARHQHPAAAVDPGAGPESEDRHTGAPPTKTVPIRCCHPSPRPLPRSLAPAQQYR